MVEALSPRFVTHLDAAVVGGVVEGRPAGAVGRVDGAEQLHQQVGALERARDGTLVQRRLPQLVPRRDVALVLQQHHHRRLRHGTCRQ